MAEKMRGEGQGCPNVADHSEPQDKLGRLCSGTAGRWALRADRRSPATSSDGRLTGRERARPGSSSAGRQTTSGMAGEAGWQEREHEQIRWGSFVAPHAGP